MVAEAAKGVLSGHLAYIKNRKSEKLALKTWRYLYTDVSKT